MHTTSKLLLQFHPQSGTGIVDNPIWFQLGQHTTNHTLSTVTPNQRTHSPLLGKAMFWAGVAPLECRQQQLADRTKCCGHSRPER